MRRIPLPRFIKAPLRYWASPRLGRLRIHVPRVPRLHRDSLRPVHLTHHPLFSITTPSFQQGRFIERTLRSVIFSGYPHLQYAVMDGGSKDETVAILEQYSPHLTHWQSARDEGQTMAINAGFAHVPSGEIMAYLNSDDLLLPNALHRVADAFNRHPDVDVVYGHRLLIDEYDREIGRWILPPHDPDILRWADFIPQETLFWRRSLWERVGGKLDERFHFAMDWELLLRFQAANARFLRLPHLLGAFRVHDRQKSTMSINESGYVEMQRLRAETHGRPISQHEVDAAIAPYLSRHLIWNGVDLLAQAVGRYRPVRLSEACPPGTARTETVPEQETPPFRLHAPRKRKQADIIGTQAIRLLDGDWHQPEQESGRVFRWVGQNAALEVISDAEGCTLALEIEPGPSLGGKPLALDILDADGQTAAQITGWHKQRYNLHLPPAPTQAAQFTLHVKDGGCPVAGDSRILNFRIFTLSTWISDIVGRSGTIRLGQGWYGPEGSPAAPFRWAAQRAEFTIPSIGFRSQLRIELEPGPALARQPLNLVFQGASEPPFVAPPILNRTVIDLPLAFDGPASLVLDTSNTTLHPVQGDPRQLCFRVFAIAVISSAESLPCP